MPEVIGDFGTLPRDMHVIKTSELTKKYGHATAVDQVSLQVDEGEIYGFLGLNGAGKTTFIRLLLGLIRADYGTCRLFGRRPTQAGTMWNDVGYLIETPHAYPNLSVEENLRVMFILRGLTDPTAIDRIVDQLHLGRYRNIKEKHLSLGNKQRLGLAKALIHEPKVLILDEPINGLDPAGIVQVRTLLKDLAVRRNTTIFVSSHILSEVAKLATRIGIIHNGALIKEINSEDLRAQIIKILRVDSTNNAKAFQLLKDRGHDISINQGLMEIVSDEAIEHPEDISTILVNHSMPPKMISIVEEDLEHYFLRIIGNES